MSKRLDLTGKKFGRLTVEGFSHIEKQSTIWNCICDCGNRRKAKGAELKSGHVKSCGCLSMDILLKRSTKHGLADTPVYKIWQGIKDRCYNTNNPKYVDYGGRGIKVCSSWLESFDNFYKDMGERPSAKHSVDRIDFNGDYEPSNCRWATAKEQANNTRRNIVLTYNGESHTMSEWSRLVNMPVDALKQRLYRGWDIKTALTTPLRQRKIA